MTATSRISWVVIFAMYFNLIYTEIKPHQPKPNGEIMIKIKLYVWDNSADGAVVPILK